MCVDGVLGVCITAGCQLPLAAAGTPHTLSCTAPAQACIVLRTLLARPRAVRAPIIIVLLRARAHTHTHACVRTRTHIMAPGGMPRAAPPAFGVRTSVWVLAPLVGPR